MQAPSFPSAGLVDGKETGDSHGKLQGQCCPAASVSPHWVVQVTSDVLLQTSSSPFPRETFCLTSLFLLFCNCVTDLPVKDLIHALAYCDFTFSWPRHFHNTHLSVTKTKHLFKIKLKLTRHRLFNSRHVFVYMENVHFFFTF